MSWLDEWFATGEIRWQMEPCVRSAAHYSRRIVYMESSWYRLGGAWSWLAYRYRTTIHISVFLPYKPTLQFIYLSFSLLLLRHRLSSLASQCHLSSSLICSPCHYRNKGIATIEPYHDFNRFVEFFFKY